MAKTLTAKLLRAHLADADGPSGEETRLRVDQVLLEDYTGTMACLQFEELGVDRVRMPFAIQYADHNVLQFDWKNQDGLRPEYLPSQWATLAAGALIAQRRSASGMSSPRPESRSRSRT